MYSHWSHYDVHFHLSFKILTKISILQEGYLGYYETYIQTSNPTFCLPMKIKDFISELVIWWNIWFLYLPILVVEYSIPWSTQGVNKKKWALIISLTPFQFKWVFRKCIDDAPIDNNNYIWLLYVTFQEALRNHQIPKSAFIKWNPTPS